jgi:hypothetical protein
MKCARYYLVTQIHCYIRLSLKKDTKASAWQMRLPLTHVSDLGGKVMLSLHSSGSLHGILQAYAIPTRRK